MKLRARRTTFTLAALLSWMALSSPNSAVAASEMSQLDIFKRCFVRLTRTVPPKDHPLLVLVAAGTKSAQTACMNLLDEAKFNTKGVLRDRTDPEGRRILKTFNDLHRTWFQSRANMTKKPLTYLVRDAEESALYFTRAAFLPSEPFSSVVTLNNGLAGVRDRIVGGETGTFMDAQMGFPQGATIDVSYFDYDPITKKRTVSAISIGGNEGVQVGELVGVKPSVSLIYPRMKAVSTKASLLGAEDDPEKAAVEINAAGLKNIKNFDGNEHFGGGLLGSQNFLLNSANLGSGEFNQGTFDPVLKEGGEKMINRRIAARMFEDVLCHELPTLPADDKEVVAAVHLKSPNTFRQSVSCQQCHVQNDGAAKAFRNIFMYYSSGDGAGLGSKIIGMSKLDTLPGAGAWAVQPSEGRLYYYQMLTKEVVKEPVSSLADIGRVFAANDDLYRCAAKRYYKFFTGIDVSFSSVAKKPLQLEHQTFVLSLASKLKEDQSVRSLISRIFASEAFRTFNYKTEAP